MNRASYLCCLGGMSKSLHCKNEVYKNTLTMLMCPFTSNELISPFLDAYGGLVLVYWVHDFAQFYHSLYKSRCTFRDQFWILEN